MDDARIEATIRELSDCIIDPDDRMSEAAIYLMVKLVRKTIDAAWSGTEQGLMEHGIIPRKS